MLGQRGRPRRQVDNAPDAAAAIEGEHAARRIQAGHRPATEIRLGPAPGSLAGAMVRTTSALILDAAVPAVGFADSAWLNSTDPPLTTVRQPIEAMGKAAVALLVSHVEGASAHPAGLLFDPDSWSAARPGRPRAGHAG